MNLKKKILTFLSQDPRMKVGLKDLARHLKVKGKEEYRALRALIEDLDRRGVIAVDERGRIGYVAERSGTKGAAQGTRKVVGQLFMTKRDFGFVHVAETGDEIFVGARFLRNALHGDTVAVVPFARPVRRRRDGDERRPEGEIVEIIKRGLTTVTGTLEQTRHFFFVVPDDERIARDIYVAREDAMHAQHGDKVVVQLHPWEDEHVNPEGKVIEVLGPAGDARVEVMSVARTFNLPLAFPQGVLHEAEQLPGTLTEEDLRDRLDYRSKVTVTIDPEDAKDFDDAVSYEPLPGGLVRLGVHIADVSHYVREGSALDQEALARGTSVYMVNEVIPMLPERLSNDLCSLRPGVDRLTYSAIMDVDRDGKVVDYAIARSVIHSARRFTYEEVQRIIEQGKGEFAEVILPLHKLSQTLLKRRRRNGSIDFDTGEAKFRFDASGLPAQIIKKIRLDSHRLIEECMLLANKTVARHIGAVRSEAGAKPFLYRVHDLPDPSRLTDLANFVKQFGYALNVKDGVSSKDLQRLLDKVEGTEVENVIHEVALRSMAKAVYSDKNIGHFGLAFKYYTHFTSPIRRYPDLVVHRLLDAYAKGRNGDYVERMRKSLPFIADQSSERERVAMEAERMSVKVMQVEYMKRHIGDEFDGVIAGVTKFGMFVEINDLLVEGLVRIAELADDYYLFDEKHYSLRGRSAGKTYRLGDAVRVQVVSVKPEEREIDFSIVE
jgi:ribonuclease R